MNELEHAIARLRDADFHITPFDEVDTAGAAFLLGWTRAYLDNRRSAGAPLPRARRFGRRYWYRIDDVLAWRRAQATGSTDLI